MTNSKLIKQIVRYRQFMNKHIGKLDASIKKDKVKLNTFIKKIDRYKKEIKEI